MNVRLVHRKTSTFHDFPYECPQRKCIHCWIINVTPPGADHCMHRCAYCYARDAVFSRESTGTLEVYDNLPELVEHDLDRIALCPPVSISNTTDPCQAVPELRREVARLVALLVRRGISLLIVTKADATFLLDVPGFADHPRRVVATSIEGPPQVLRLLSPGAPTFRQRLASVERLAAAGVPCAVRLDPVFPPVYQALYGAKWLKKPDGLMEKFAEKGCRHVICSTGRISRRPARGAQTSMLERMQELLRSLGKGAAEALERDYVYDRSGTSQGYLWRRPERLAFHQCLREMCESRGMTYATCQETAAAETDSPGTPTCEGFPLPFCSKDMTGRFHPIDGCTALCHVSCAGMERPPCGRRELCSPKPLVIKVLR